MHLCWSNGQNVLLNIWDKYWQTNICCQKKLKGKDRRTKAEKLLFVFAAWMPKLHLFLPNGPFCPCYTSVISSPGGQVFEVVTMLGALLVLLCISPYVLGKYISIIILLFVDLRGFLMLKRTSPCARFHHHVQPKEKQAWTWQMWGRESWNGVHDQKWALPLHHIGLWPPGGSSSGQNLKMPKAF